MGCLSKTSVCVGGEGADTLRGGIDGTAEHQRGIRPDVLNSDGTLTNPFPGEGNMALPVSCVQTWIALVGWNGPGQCLAYFEAIIECLDIDYSISMEHGDTWQIWSSLWLRYWHKFYIRFDYLKSKFSTCSRHESGPRSPGDFAK